MKRIFSIFLAFIIALSMFSIVNVSAFAKTVEGYDNWGNAYGMIYDVQVEMSYRQDLAREFAQKINEFRTGDNTWYYSEEGDGKTEKIWVDNLKPYYYNYKLEKAAMQRAADLSLRFDHFRPNGWSFGNVAHQITEEYGDEYLTVLSGECIGAMGFSNLDRVLKTFLEEDNSYEGQGHRRILMDNNRSIGICMAYATYTIPSGSEKVIPFVVIETGGCDAEIEYYDEQGVSHYDQSLFESLYCEPCVETKTMTVPVANWFDKQWNIDWEIRTKTEFDTQFNNYKEPYTDMPIEYYIDDEIVDFEKIGVSFQSYYTSYRTFANPEFMNITIADESIAKLYEADGITPADPTRVYNEPLKLKLLKMGETTIRCEVFGDTVREIPLIVKCDHDRHDRIILQDIPKTCQQDGVYEYECSGCGEIFKTVTEHKSTDHNWETIEYTPAVCGGFSHYVMKCSYCGLIHEQDGIIRQEHEPYQAPAQEATCTQEGWPEHTMCALCGKHLESCTITPKLSHTFSGDEYVVTTATCTIHGLKKCYCTSCNNYVTVDYSDLDNHVNTVVTQNGYAPTCTTNGKADTVYCQDCGKQVIKGVWRELYINDQVYYTSDIPKLGHEVVTTNTPATCESRGYITYTCTRCNETEIEYTDEPLDHNYVETNRVNATCSSEGSITYTCTACGKTKSETLPVKEHNFVGQVDKIPTCIEEGWGNVTCTECGYSYNGAIPKLNHTLKSKTVNPTCTTQGYTTFYCDECNISFNSNYTEQLGHITDTYVKANEIEGTCVTQGSYDKVYYCTRCNEILSSEKVKTNYKAHNYVVTIVPASTTADGSCESRCSVCNASYPKTTIPKIASINLSKTSYTYNGKNCCPAVTVIGSDGKLISNEFYTISYPVNCKNVGKYPITITFDGNTYVGTETRYFTVNPPTTELSSVKPASKKITVSWKKKTAQVTGYQIQYSTDSKFKKGVKTVNISKNKTTSTAIKNLKGKKKYYVRIRTYKTVGKTKYYSNWSKVKTVTTKK